MISLLFPPEFKFLNRPLYEYTGKYLCPVIYPTTFIHSEENKKNVLLFFETDIFKEYQKCYFGFIGGLTESQAL